MARGWVGLTVDHLVSYTDVPVGKVGSQFILELASDHHWLRYDFTGNWVDFACVNDLIVNGERSSSNQRETICIVGHLQPEVVVSRNAGARVPCALNCQGGWLQSLAAFVWKVLFESKDDVDWSKSIRKERFWVVTQQQWVEWTDVGLQAANRFVSVEDAVLVEVTVRNIVAVAIIEAQVGIIRLWFWQGD